MSGKGEKSLKLTADTLETAGIQWHPGFYGAAEIEFLSNKKDLKFEQEYNLSKQPVRMDLLVVKKVTDTVMENEIGHLFRKYNVIEYKSPDDGLTIDDYYKTMGYACLYKGLGRTVDQIPAEDVTVSIFRERYPRELFKKLKLLGGEICRRYPGIYYILGKQALFDTQIVVTRELDNKGHSTLRILSRHAQEEDIKIFIGQAAGLTEPGDRSNADAVLQVSVSANRQMYETIRRCDDTMCDALRELMKDDYEKMNKEFEEKMKAETERMKTEFAKAKAEFVKAKAESKKMKAESEKAKVETEKAKAESEKMRAEYEEMRVRSENVKQDTLLATLKNLMETMKWTAEQAMAAMKIPDADRGLFMVGEGE